VDYLYLCFSALISATVFPMGSEALFVYDLTVGLNPVLLLLFATLGNVIGSWINYFLGLKGEDYLVEKKLLDEQRITKYKHLFDKHGGYLLLLSWMPFIGDIFPFIAGILHYDLKKFFFFVTVAKFGRYFVLYLLV
jgi:membrane protein YqaA with SNARE-associated domain